MADANANEVSCLEMSDEELLNIDPTTLAPVVTPTEGEAGEEVSNDEGEAGNAGNDDGKQSAHEGAASTETPEKGLLNEGDEGSTDEPETAKATAEAVEGETKEPEVKKPEAEATPDYEALYKQILAPFKANGREIAVKNADDAIALMQMGANYNKKMAALKPNLRLMKLLENNGLLSEEKLGYLIDLDKKNPAAISKLVKDSGLDLLDLDAEKAGDYTPKAHTVDDRELDLDAVLDEIQSTPTYAQTLNIVSKLWDGASKQVIANSPQLLKVINSHVQLGIYDLISKEIESERMFGRLDGLSDIEAYRQVGDAMQARGGFAHLGTQTQGQQTPTAPVVVTPKPSTDDDAKLREKKRAASPAKPAVVGKTAPDYNPLALSDEAFDKLVQSEYL